MHCTGEDALGLKNSKCRWILVKAESSKGMVRVLSWVISAVMTTLNLVYSCVLLLSGRVLPADGCYIMLDRVRWSSAPAIISWRGQKRRKTTVRESAQE